MEQTGLMFCFKKKRYTQVCWSNKRSVNWILNVKVHSFIWESIQLLTFEQTKQHIVRLRKRLNYLYTVYGNTDKIFFAHYLVTIVFLHLTYARWWFLTLNIRHFETYCVFIIFTYYVLFQMFIKQKSLYFFFY